MCDLPGGLLPVAVNGVIYVPYSLFDKSATGVDLGVYYGLAPDRGPILSLYSLSGRFSGGGPKRRCPKRAPLDDSCHARSFV